MNLVVLGQLPIALTLKCSEGLSSDHELMQTPQSQLVPLPVIFPVVPQCNITLPRTYINAATGFIEILQCLNWGSTSKSPGAVWPKQWNSSIKFLSVMWKLTIGKIRLRHPSGTPQGGHACHAATHPVNLVFSGRLITVALEEICKAGWAVWLSRQNRVPSRIHNKERPVLRGWQC